MARLNPSIVQDFDIAAMQVETGTPQGTLDLMRISTEQSAAHIIWMLELRRLAHRSSDEEFWRTLVYNRDSQLGPATSLLGDSFACWYFKITLEVEGWSTGNISIWGHRDLFMKSLTPFQDAWSNLSNQRTFFASEEGRIGWVPGTARAADRIFVLKGMRVPVVMAPLEESGWWRLVGACYVHGLMDGEGEDMSQDRWQTLQII